MYWKLLGFLSLILFVTISCQQSNELKSGEIIDPQLAQGFQLLESQCFSCHNPNAKAEKRIAPTIESIKSHYISEGVTAESFSKDLIDFMEYPNPEKSKMKNAIRVFGLMPKLDISEEHLKDIAAYLYKVPLEDPAWYEKQYEAEKKKYKDFVPNEPKNKLELAISYALATKAVLGKNLLNAIQTKGTEGAIGFCSERAIELTDSMSMVQNVQIKRVSDNNRNENNYANENELDYINRMKNRLQNGEKAMPELADYRDLDIAYIPIMTNDMCLQCHGKVDEKIQAPVLKKIQSIYPNDKAIGYSSNELRGIWVVEMNK